MDTALAMEITDSEQHTALAVTMKQLTASTLAMEQLMALEME